MQGTRVSFEVADPHSAGDPGQGTRSPGPGNADSWEQGQEKGEGRPLGPYGFLGRFTILRVQTVLAAAWKQTARRGQSPGLLAAGGGLPSMGCCVVCRLGRRPPPACSCGLRSRPWVKGQDFWPLPETKPLPRTRSKGSQNNAVHGDGGDGAKQGQEKFLGSDKPVKAWRRSKMRNVL